MNMISRMVSIAVVGGAMALSVTPATVQAGGAQMLKQCLAERAGEPGQKRVQSECRWKYYEYMASYGK